METNLSQYLRKHKTKLYFHGQCISELNAIKGLVEILDIRSDHFKICSGAQINKRLISKFFPETSTKKPLHSRTKRFNIKFNFNIQDQLNNESLILNHEPYKYFSAPRPAKHEKTRTRKLMNIPPARKVIVFSSTYSNEIKMVIEAYQQLKLQKKPFLVVALREPDSLLTAQLIKKGLNAIDRSNAAESLSELSAYDVVVLNTAGELTHFYKIADLAIIGHDRNLFEPAQACVPILYFKGPLNPNQTELRMLKLFKLAWRKNKLARQMLDKTGGAAAIATTKLRRQIEKVLIRPEKMIRGTQDAVRKLRKETIPYYKKRVSALLISGLSQNGRT